MRESLCRGLAWFLIVLGPSIAASAGPALAAEPVAQRISALTDERFGIRTPPILLLSRPDVRADLGLTPKQTEDAQVEIANLYVRAAALKGQTGPSAVAARKQVDDAQRLWFEGHLSPEQLNRLVQVDLQWEGPSALLSRPMVSDALSLSAEQRVALKQAIAARDAARVRGSSRDAAEHALALQTLKILTADQKGHWRAMLGKRFVPQIATALPAAPAPK